MEKRLLIFLVLLLAPAIVPGWQTAMAQTPAPAADPLANEKSTLAGLGGSFNQFTHPQTSITFFEANRAIPGTWNFNAVDVTFSRGASSQLQTETSLEAGIGQYMRSIGPVRLYALALTGPATGAKNGWAWSAGLGPYLDFGKGWGLLGAFRALSVPDPTAAKNVIQGIFSILVTFGR
jgi:hypothetical protein